MQLCFNPSRHTLHPISRLVVCRSAGVIAVDVGIAVSGAGINASVIYNDALLFPLRLGFACAVPVPLASVFIVNVSDYVGGSLTVFYPVAATAAVNVRSAACPGSSSRRLVALVAGYADTQAASPRLPWVEHRRLADVASMSIRVNGTYVVVGLRIDVVVPAAVLAAAGGNLLSIATVSGVVASVNAILPSGVNSSNSSGLFGAAVGAFLTAAATAVGTNASALAAGSTGAPSLAVASATGSTTGAASASNSGGGGLSPGAIAGIVVSLLLLLLVCVALLCCFINKWWCPGRKAIAVPLSDAPPGGSQVPAVAQMVPSSISAGGGDTLPVISNPMLALREQRSTSTAVGTAGADELLRKGGGDPMTTVGALPSYTNPLSKALEQRAQPRAAAAPSDVRGLPRDSDAITAATSM